jgi:ABC-type nitrate/sulfonate/bicarbonate transport system substrate-binding protein
MALNRDGNAITLSLALAERMKAAHAASPASPAASPAVSVAPPTPAQTAAILADVVAERRAAGLKPITAGVVFGFSNHVHQVSAWLRLGGLEPDRDVPLVVIPPPLMVESLLAGHIDLFCAGAPWNAMADAAGAGRLLHPCAEILPGLVEKLLVVRAAHADAPWLPALTRALLEAAAWCHDSANRPLLARHLARPDYVGAPVALIERILAGQVPTVFGGSTRPWISFDPAALAPDETALRVLFDQMALSRQVPDSAEAWARARMIPLPDVHAAALALPGL